MDIPPDITIQNETWYSIEWTASDDNPTIYNITRNSTLVDAGTWQSSTPIKYDLFLDIGVYNFTIYVYDADENSISDSVIINATDLNLPILNNIQTLQNGEDREYFRCGDGPFTLQISNSTPVNIGVELRGYYPGYDIEVYSGAVSIVISPYSFNTLTYNLNYNSSLNDFLLKPTSTDEYLWNFDLLIIKVNSIEYNVLNLITIKINSGEEFIYNQTAYGGMWGDLTLERSNKDVSPPSYEPPVVNMPDDPSTNFEVNINVTDEQFGSGVKEVNLYYSVNGGQWNEVKMLLHNGLYSAGIPRKSEGTEITYKVEFVDYAGNSDSTTEYTFTAPISDGPSILVPALGVLIGTVGAVSIAGFYRIRQKRKITEGR